MKNPRDLSADECSGKKLWLRTYIRAMSNTMVKPCFNKEMGENPNLGDFVNKSCLGCLFIACGIKPDRGGSVLVNN